MFNREFDCKLVLEFIWICGFFDWFFVRGDVGFIVF